MSQVTVKLKPGAAYGEDAEIAESGGCVFTGNTKPLELMNSGSENELNYAQWTYSSLGCGVGSQRFLIKFKGLDTIPSSATIVSAKINFFGVPSSANWGTSYFTGSPYPLTNEGWIQRVTGSWSESTVTWSTQPTSVTTNRVAVSKSAARFGWNTSVDVSTLVKDIKTAGVNNGFLVQLQTEAYYRRVTFASSDHPDATLWPEMEITYTVPNSITNRNAEIYNVTVYPNPSRDIIHTAFHVSEQSSVRIMICDVLGRVIQTTEPQVLGPGNHDIPISVAGCSSGAYLLKLTSNSGVISRSITVTE
jgi:hypothetical protein